MIKFLIIILIFVVVLIFVQGFKKQAIEHKRKYKTITTKNKETLLFELTGVHLPENRRYISGFVNQNQVVTLKFEPDNKYDENAIMVLHNDVCIGYVPSYEIEEVKEFMLKYDYYAFIYKKEIQNFGYLYMEIGLVQK